MMLRPGLCHVLAWCLSLLPLCWISHPAGASNSHQSLSACDGGNVSFSWPCDLQYDTVKGMNLTFLGLNNEGVLVASITHDGTVTVAQEYKHRVTSRGTSGVFLHGAAILDSGVYVAQADFDNGTTVQDYFTLSVHLPPLLSPGHLKMQLSDSGDHCRTLTCGSVLFPGYPAVTFLWQTPSGQKAFPGWKQSSRMQACPLLPGNYSCQLSGPALTCGPWEEWMQAEFFISSKLTVTHPSKGVKSAGRERLELVLMIVVPTLAVLFPLCILGMWVLRHLLSDCRRHPLPSRKSGLDDIEVGSSPSRGSHLGEPSPDDTVPLTTPDDEEEEGETLAEQLSLSSNTTTTDASVHIPADDGGGDGLLVEIENAASPDAKDLGETRL